MEVLSRGPIHEAFAEVSVDAARPEMVISRTVPEPINEIPPDYRPEGDNVQWIPGYWSWDDDQGDFIWVSGVWRDLPPGRQWVPGYWVTVAGGNQFVSGYWAETHQAETVYLPPPPEPPLSAPGVPAYSADNIWVNGHWLWSRNGYVWQAGYWLRQRPEMAWIPAHYVWTPRGYIFVRGYWDYHLFRRGVMFAPRYYSRPIYRAHDYYYTPSIVLDINTIFLSLFIRQDHHHYYFGDYHDVRYTRRGFIPWYSKHATRHGYDPYYTSYRWHQSRHDDRWEHNYRKQFEYHRDHREARPSVLYRSQVEHNQRSYSRKDTTPGRHFTEVVRKNDRDSRSTSPRSGDKKDYRENGRKVAPPKVERRAVELSPERTQKSWPKSVTHVEEERNRSKVSHRSNVFQAHYPEDQARGMEKNRQSGISSYSNQSRRIDPKKENRTMNQPLKNQERRQPMIAEGQKNTERRVKPGKSIEEQGPDLKSDLPQGKKKGKRPVGSENQVAGPEDVVQADVQIIKRPRSVWGQQASRSYEK
ncbi:YXWGXW repeat-containing protein [Desulfopila aestuarii]|nr:YXWGXW repeat-containing protein [Desulfopila aestuarii]